MATSDQAPPVHRQFMRRQQVAYELGMSRHTVARLIKNDADFPTFFELTPGISVIERTAFDRWLISKRVKARVKTS